MRGCLLPSHLVWAMAKHAFLVGAAAASTLLLLGAGIVATQEPGTTGVPRNVFLPQDPLPPPPPGLAPAVSKRSTRYHGFVGDEVPGIESLRGTLGLSDGETFLRQLYGHRFRFRLHAACLRFARSRHISESEVLKGAHYIHE